MPLRLRVLSPTSGRKGGTPAHAAVRSVVFEDNVGQIRIGRRPDLELTLPYSPLSSVHARLLWTGEAALREGGEFILKLATAGANAQIARLHHSVDIESYAEAPAESLAMNGIGLATLTLDRQLAVLDYTSSRELGGFILIDRLSNQTVAFGFIETRRARDKTRSVAEAGAASRAVLRLVGWRGAQERRAWLGFAGAFGLFLVANAAWLAWVAIHGRL